MPTWALIVAIAGFVVNLAALGKVLVNTGKILERVDSHHERLDAMEALVNNLAQRLSRLEGASGLSDVTGPNTAR